MEPEAMIYLDHNATTPVDPVVREAMMPYLDKEFGNPSSGYALGVRAGRGMDKARERVAGLLGCAPEEVVFTSGGSEANNMVLKGILDMKDPGAAHVITSAVEHPAILNPALYLSELGVKVSIVPVDGAGRVDPRDVAQAITPQTRLISIMLANNETGTLQPLKAISSVAAEYNVPVHTDAAQAIGKIPVDVNDLGVDFMSVAGHKVYAPKGIGALFIRKGRDLTPLVHGAAQEMGRRAGTENVILAAGLGAACRVAMKRVDGDVTELARMRDRLQETLFDGLDGLVLNGHSSKRLPNTLHFSVPGLEGDKILEGIPSVMASTGAACHDRSVSLSHVLSAMGVSPHEGMGALRLTLGRMNTHEQVDEAARLFLGRIREMRNA